MSKDNFDLRSFLTENRLTENSRGTEGRYHFDGSQNNTGRARVLVEMRMPADPESEDLDDLDAVKVDECGGDFGAELNEAGYSDDADMEFGDNDDDLTLQNLLAKDTKAARARRAASKDMDLDSPSKDVDDAPVDAPDVDDDEPAVGSSDPSAAAEAGISSGLKYNPDLVEFEMDTPELDQYLSGFRRPKVAVNFLNRALKAAQDEVNDMNIGSKTTSLKLVLGRDGYYHTRRIARPDERLIATVHGDPNYKNWED